MVTIKKIDDIHIIFSMWLVWSFSFQSYWHVLGTWRLIFKFFLNSLGDISGTKYKVIRRIFQKSQILVNLYLSKFEDVISMLTFVFFCHQVVIEGPTNTSGKFHVYETTTLQVTGGRANQPPPPPRIKKPQIAHQKQGQQIRQENDISWR